MTDKTVWTQGIKNPWQRISIMFALCVISGLSTMYGVVQSQKRSDDRETLLRERNRADTAEKKLQEYLIESIKKGVTANETKDIKLSLQDSTKQILNIKQ